jgi:dTDP-4-amino-4,6-dideoxygalactose transaminase
MTTNRLHQIIDLDSAFIADKQNLQTYLPEPLNGNHVITTAYGRNAIYLGLQEIARLTPKREILVPSYTCGDELAAIIAAGFNIKTFSITEDFSININGLRHAISKKTIAIFFTHYFGFPCPNLTELVELSQQHGLYLIEDCAHALGSHQNGRPLGTVGDISIFSLRKFYPIPHGGALVINNKNINPPSTVKMSPAALNRDLSIYFGYQSGLLTPGVPLNIQTNNADKHGARLSEFGGYTLGISKFASYLLTKVDFEAVRKTRLATFKYYLDFFSGNKRRYPIFNQISDSVCPLFFPIKVRNSEKTAQELRRSQGIFVQPFWSNLHEYVNWDIYPEAKVLKQTTLVLPVHTQLDKSLLIKLLKHV